MIRSHAALLVFVCSLLLFVSQSANAIAPVPQTEVESNDTPGTATPLVLDSDDRAFIVGSLTVGDNDYFSFNAPAGAKAWILVDTGGDQVSGSTSRDSTLTLLKSDGVTEVEFDDDDGTGTGCDGSIESGLASSIAGANLSDGGQYFIKVNEFQQNAELNPYRLKLVVTNGPQATLFSGSSPADSHNIIAPVLTTNSIEASTSVGGAAWFGIEGRAGDSLFLSLRGGDVDLDLALFDADGTTQLIEVDSDSSAPRSEGFCFVLPATGRYYVKVFDIGGVDAGSFSLMASTYNSDGSCEIFSASKGPIGTGIGFHGVQIGRLNRFSPPTTCSFPETSPGFFSASGERPYDEFRFTNTGLAANCVSALVQPACGLGNYFLVAYKDSFDPNNIETNYLADPASSSTPGKIMSFNVNAGQDFSLVMHDLTPGQNCEGYSLRVCSNYCTDLAIAKTADKSDAPIGLPLTYTLHVTNNGPEDATNVIGSDVVPASMSIIGTTATQGSVNAVGNAVSYSLGAMAPGDSADVTISVIPNSQGVQVNSASVQGSGFDINVASNESSVVVATGTDGDGDGQVSGSDNCPTVANPSQEDSDSDGVGNVCDNCPTVANPSQSNADGDLIGDACDVCPTDALKTAPGACGCGVADVDTNQNGVLDCNSTLELNALLQSLQRNLKKLKAPTTTKAQKALRKRKKAIRANLASVNTILKGSVDSVQTKDDDVNLAKLNNVMRKAIKGATTQLSAKAKRKAISKVKRFKTALLVP